MSDYIPSADEHFAQWHENFASRLPTYFATLGLVMADATAVSTDQSALRQAIRDQVAKANDAQAATASKRSTRSAAEKRARGLVQRLKAHPSYTVQMGEALGIETSSGTAGAGGGGAGGGSAGTLARAALAIGSPQRPQLKSRTSSSGQVALTFRKDGHTGVLLYGRRGGETGEGWTLLAKQLRSPFVDGRDNLVAGQPETREYQAQYLDNDQAMGQLSDVLVVTVAAQRHAAAEAAAQTTPRPAA